MQPIVVVPGWWVEAKGNYPVKVMKTEFVKYLAGRKRQFTPAQLEPVCRRFEEAWMSSFDHNPAAGVRSDDSLVLRSLLSRKLTATQPAGFLAT